MEELPPLKVAHVGNHGALLWEKTPRCRRLGPTDGNGGGGQPPPSWAFILQPSREDFKTSMLASARALLPETWDTTHENAWRLGFV